MRTLKDIPDRRRFIYIGNEPLQFIETCTNCGSAVKYKDRCLQHYAEYATRQYIEKQAALVKSTRLALPVLLRPGSISAMTRMKRRALN